MREADKPARHDFITNIRRSGPINTRVGVVQLDAGGAEASPHGREMLIYTARPPPGDGHVRRDLPPAVTNTPPQRGLEATISGALNGRARRAMTFSGAEASCSRAPLPRRLVSGDIPAMRPLALLLLFACSSPKLVAGLAPPGGLRSPRRARVVLSSGGGGGGSSAARDLLYKDQMLGMAARALLEKDLLEGKNQSPMAEPKWSKKREKASLAGRGFGGGQAKLGKEVRAHAAVAALVLVLLKITSPPPLTNQPPQGEARVVARAGARRGGVRVH